MSSGGLRYGLPSGIEDAFGMSLKMPLGTSLGLSSGCPSHPSLCLSFSLGRSFWDCPWSWVPSVLAHAPSTFAEVENPSCVGLCLRLRCSSRFLDREGSNKRCVGMGAGSENVQRQFGQG